MKAAHKDLLDLATPYLDTRKNDIHVDEVVRIAPELIEAVKADEDIVIPALILHDVGWKMVPENLHLRAFGPRGIDEDLRHLHELEGARLAGEILAKVGYDEKKVDEIVRIIEGHDSRTEAISLNDMVVKDCDKLTRFCNLGFNIDAERFNYPPVKYVVWLEKQIDGWFFTDMAKRLAREELAQRKIEINSTPVQ